MLIKLNKLLHPCSSERCRLLSLLIFCHALAQFSSIASCCRSCQLSSTPMGKSFSVAFPRTLLLEVFRNVLSSEE